MHRKIGEKPCYKMKSKTLLRSESQKVWLQIIWPRNHPDFVYIIHTQAAWVENVIFAATKNGRKKKCLDDLNNISFQNPEEISVLIRSKSDP